MNKIQKLFLKIRYGLVTQEILTKLAERGIKIDPYYLFVESLRPGLQDLETGFDGYEAGLLGCEDAKAIASGRAVSEQEILRRFRQGKLCLGTRYRGELAAYTWCDLEECNFEGHRFPLRENEAYLFDSYTFWPFRGKNLAAYTRYQCYKQLAPMGRSKFYSITEFFNTASKRFKEKLGASPLELCLFLEFFNRWRFHSRIRKY